MTTNKRDFILQNTRLQRPAFVPEVQLYLADEITPLWHMTERELGEAGVPPPFWAFAWAGGLALARYILDHPAEVVGKSVIDFATGSGLCAIAALKAGATSALAADIDPFCAAAVELNANANAVSARFIGQDLLRAEPPTTNLIIAGDFAYELPLATRLITWLRQAHDRGTRILIGDPGRTYFPRASLVLLAEYDVPTSRDLEDGEIKHAGVYTFPNGNSATNSHGPPM